MHTDPFQDAGLRAVNLSHDTDTTAVVCGQLAGAYYGVSGISERERLARQFGLDVDRVATRLLCLPLGEVWRVEVW